jgi:hypothetical protein
VLRNGSKVGLCRQSPIMCKLMVSFLSLRGIGKQWFSASFKAVAAKIAAAALAVALTARNTIIQNVLISHWAQPCVPIIFKIILI